MLSPARKAFDFGSLSQHIKVHECNKLRGLTNDVEYKEPHMCRHKYGLSAFMACNLGTTEEKHCRSFEDPKTLKLDLNRSAFVPLSVVVVVMKVPTIDE